MSIEDIRDLRLRKQKIESDKKARKYILEINQRYRKIKDYSGNNFLEKYEPF
jgi:ferritin